MGCDEAHEESGDSVNVRGWRNGSTITTLLVVIVAVVVVAGIGTVCSSMESGIGTIACTVACIDVACIAVAVAVVSVFVVYSVDNVIREGVEEFLNVGLCLCPRGNNNNTIICVLRKGNGGMITVVVVVASPSFLLVWDGCCVDCGGVDFLQVWGVEHDRCFSSVVRVLVVCVVRFLDHGNAGNAGSGESSLFRSSN